MNNSPASVHSAPPLGAPPQTDEMLLDSILCQADTHFARKEWLATRVCLELAVSIAPNNAGLLNALGSLQYQLQQYPAACATLTNALKNTPDDPDLHIQLAMVHTQLGQEQQAKQSLQQSLTLRPKNPLARELLGNLDFAAGRWAAGADHYCAAMNGNPDGISLLLCLGKCQQELLDLDSARWCFKRVLTLEPSNPIARDAMQILSAKTGGVNPPVNSAVVVVQASAVSLKVAAPVVSTNEKNTIASPNDSKPQISAFPIGKFKPVFAEPSLTSTERDIAEKFHDIYYSKLDSGRGLHTIVLSWLGYEMFKCPLDLWTYQELIVNQKPDVIIETGTYKGGSALFLASVCDLIGHGQIVTIDVDATHQAIRPVHPRITYLHGSSTAPEMLEQTKTIIAGRTNVLVILDSDHRCDHVLAELHAYRSMVPVGGHLIVEDTNINGHPTYKEFGPGPWEAVEKFLAEDRGYVADRSCERFILTMNPRGFLRRIGQ